jgi:hypothetical protein
MEELVSDRTLVERLQAAAAAAIADVAPQLEAADVRQVRALLFELTLANAGEVTEATCWIERTAWVARGRR